MSFLKLAMKQSMKFAGEALQALELVVYACAATVLVAVGPLIWSYRLFAGDRIAGSAIVAILWLGSVGLIACEVRRKAITAVSLGVFLAWLIVLVWVFHDWFF